MKHNQVGNSGLQVSAFTYGNWLTHGSQVDFETSISCVNAALDTGITSFDTADSYANGAAEECLGTALKGVRRESVVVMTKVFFPVFAGQKGKNEAGLSRKHIMEGINASLKRLNMDYVDVYQAHRFDKFTPLEETIQAFADILRAGKALYIGVSEWTPDALRRGQNLARELGFSLISNQPQYSMLWRVIEGEVVPTCEELGISQLVWSPLAQGILSGKYKVGQLPPVGSRANDVAGGGASMIKRWMSNDVLEAVQQLVPIAHELGLTLPQLALSWVLNNQNVASAIIGASRPEQITSNVLAAEYEIPRDAILRINEILSSVAVMNPELTAQFTPQDRLI